MAPEKLKERKKRVARINRELKKLFPEAKVALSHKNALELLVAVILSAQATDKKINEITKNLFKKYKTLDDYVKADPRKFEQDIRQSGFYRNKTKNILGAAKMIKEKYDGKVPNTMEDLVKLPGVARKTANIVLTNAYGVVEGIAVDTHVARLARKLDLTDHKDPIKIEKDLMEIIPRGEWKDFNSRIVLYGRHICRRRKHSDCAEHPLTKIYPPRREYLAVEIFSASIRVKHVDIKIYGRVQMVMFRDSARRRARRLSLVGFVYNDDDGSVYVEVEGDSENLDEFIEWCHNGSPLARVDRVEVNDGKVAGFNSFEIRY